MRSPWFGGRGCEPACPRSSVHVMATWEFPFVDGPSSNPPPAGINKIHPSAITPDFTASALGDSRSVQLLTNWNETASASKGRRVYCTLSGRGTGATHEAPHVLFSRWM